MSVLIKLRRGFASDWLTQNVVLASGEPGLEIDTGRLKIGNGSLSWNSLAYASIIPSGFIPSSGININLGTNGSNATISVSGLNSSYISDFNEAVDDRVGSGLFVVGTGINLSYNDSGNSFTVSVTGLISNPTNNRILTSRDSTTTGIDAESNLTFDGTTLNVTGDVSANYYFGDFDGPVVYDCRNNTGSTIDKGTPVYISGHFANGKVDIETADASNSAKMPALGLLGETLTTGQEGHVHMFGALSNVDTQTPGYTVGQTLYVSPTGGLTTTKPTASNHLIQNIARVARVSDTNGRLLVLGPARTNDIPNSGNFASLTVNSTDVSVIGHTHTSSDITNFNTSVSGLLPTVANSGDNRLLTSTGTTTGVNGESNATFDGTTLAVSGVISVDNLLLDGNTLSSTSGDIVINPSGTITGNIGGLLDRKVLYFGTGSTTWDTSSNWYYDKDLTLSANTVPTSEDTAILAGSAYVDSAGAGISAYNIVLKDSAYISVVYQTIYAKNIVLYDSSYIGLNTCTLGSASDSCNLQFYDLSYLSYTSNTYFYGDFSMYDDSYNVSSYSNNFYGDVTIKCNPNNYDKGLQSSGGTSYIYGDLSVANTSGPSFSNSTVSYVEVYGKTTINLAILDYCYLNNTDINYANINNSTIYGNVSSVDASYIDSCNLYGTALLSNYSSLSNSQVYASLYLTDNSVASSSSFYGSVYLSNYANISSTTFYGSVEILEYSNIDNSSFESCNVFVALESYITGSLYFNGNSIIKIGYDGYIYSGSYIYLNDTSRLILSSNFNYGSIGNVAIYTDNSEDGSVVEVHNLTSLGSPSTINCATLEFHGPDATGYLYNIILGTVKKIKFFDTSYVGNSITTPEDCIIEFHDRSYMYSGIELTLGTNGVAKFYDTSYNGGGTISGGSLVEFYDRSYSLNGSIISTPKAIFYGDSSIDNVTLDKTAVSLIYRNIPTKFTPSTIVTNQNNYDPGFADILRLEAGGGDNRNITGLVLKDRHIITIINIASSYNLILKHQDSSSTAANRFITPTGGDHTIPPNGTISLVYDDVASRWVVTSAPIINSSYISDFNEAVDDRIGSGLFVAGTGINLTYNDGGNSFTVSASGLIASPSGNRILTSRDNTTTGIDAESNATFDGTTLAVGGSITVNNLKLDGNTLSSTNSEGNIIINPSGTGALQRDSGGNTRGYYAVDWQTSRTENNQVAGGNFSVICGGEQNKVVYELGAVVGGRSNVAFEFGFIGGGYNNRQTTANNGYYNAIVGGYSNEITASTASPTNVPSSNFIGGGELNTIYESAYSVIAGGDSNYIGGQTSSPYANYTTIPGGYEAKTLDRAQLAYANGKFSSVGDAQYSLYILKNTTSSNGFNSLYLDYNTNNDDTITIDNTTATFTINISGRDSSGNSAGFIIRGCIKNYSSTVSLVGSPVIESFLDSSFATANVEVYTGNSGLTIRADQGSSGAGTTYWVATVQLSRVTI